MADSKVEYPAPDCLAPAAIEAKTEVAGVTKANLPVAKAFLLAMFAGAFIAFGGLFFTVFLSDSTLGWGAQRVVGGLCFCLGLVLVLVCGAELFTGNSLMVCALKSKKITLVQMLKAWVVVWVGNFVGALFIVFLVYMAGIYKLNGEAVANSMVSVAAGKVTIDWVTIFFRGILCNIFVCLAVWIGTAGKTVVDKVVGILLPIAAFVISLRIGELVRRDGRMWLLPLALGLLYMLADFLTFRLANMLAFDKINLPQWDLFFIGAAISALGLLIGRLLGRRRSKPA